MQRDGAILIVSLIILSALFFHNSNYSMQIVRSNIYNKLRSNQFSNLFFQSTMASSAVSTSNNNSNLVFKLRKSAARGHADHGWLNSYHTFSFASYFDANYPGFGVLRVINEDRVSPSEGFPEHPHQNFEIYSYIVNGCIKHKDSLGHSELLKRGQVQFTSAGSGLAHSEYNGSSKELLHFLQIWVKPNVNNIKPSYSTKEFPDSAKEGKLCLIISPDGRDNSIQVHNDLYQYASLIKNGEEIKYQVAAGRVAYIQVVQDANGFNTEANQTGINVNGNILAGGDGLFITQSNDKEGGELVITGAHKLTEGRAEFLLFDLPKPTK
jgi:redox-sensitive bicupin YhaK (pirin superfamily)